VWPWVRASLAVLTAVALLAGCTPTDDSGPPGPDGPANAVLSVTTIGSRLPSSTRNRLESQVSDVLAAYVVGAFLGDYPRQDFLGGFDRFTSGAAKLAVADIDALTASGFEKVTAVRATRLDARLSFLAPDDRAVGASAWVDFAFDVAQGGSTVKVRLTGRLALGLVDGTWAVFGYSLVRDDSDALPVEVSSS
jgi:hypothetical protein